MASSADYGKSKFNLAAQGHRQPGSTFKVMALMTALRKGVDPRSTTYVSKPLKFTDPQWGPIDVQTYGHDYHGSISLEQATLYSDNTVYEQLALDLGPPEVKQTAYDMGIKTHLDGYPAESLGGLTIGVSPLEMADAYATIASGGYRNRPTAITKITYPRRQVGAPARASRSSAPRRSPTASRPRRRGSSRRTSRRAPARARRSAARRPARPARPTRSTTRGSSASRRGWPPRCGSATRTRRSR